MAIRLEKLQFKTQFGDIHIPVQIIEGLNFKTGFYNVLIDIPSSIHPVADGITIPIYNGVTPFPTDSSYVVRGELDDYSIRADLSNNRLYFHAINNNFTMLLTDRSGNGYISGFYPIFGDTYGNYWSWLSGQDQYRFSATVVDQFVEPTNSRVGFASYASYSRPSTGRWDLAANSPVVIYLTDLLNSWSNMPVPDPYSPGGTSTHGGGGRSFDNTSDPVALPSLPSDPVLNSGFVTMYQMDVLKLNSLANFLWDASLFDTETWQKVLANPFDAIISLNYIPASPTVLSDRPIQIGNITTNVSAAPVADQFVQIDCQTLDVEEYGGTYLDYNPYTKVEIYLPYIGFRDLNTDEVMDKTLHLIYNVDIVTGTCVANILVYNTVLYQFTGNCALSIPLTGRDAGKNFAALLSLVSAGAVVGAGAYSGTLDAAGAVKAVSATAQAVMGAKRNIQRSGSVSGAAGFMGGQTPYLIITRPRQALPESQNSFTGYPSFVTENLSDLTGFTTIESVHLEGIPGTSAEIAEIESLLSSGVIL